MQALINSSLQAVLDETGLTVRYVMVNIVEAATTISQLRRLRSLIIAIVMIGCMLIFLYLGGYKKCTRFTDTPYCIAIVSPAGVFG